MSYKITGVIYKTKETETFKSKSGGNDFKKRAFVLDVNDGNYPQKIQLEFIQDKCDLLNNFKIGQEVEVEFNLQGREWDGGAKGFCYFNTLQAWRISAVGNQQPQAAPQPAQEPPPMPDFESDDDQTVPF